jgi:membrane-bound serine protease (ClpP class)
MLDPNIAYFILVFGLWAGVSATYLPGTGIKEGLAFLLLLAAGAMLLNMPTNWVAVLILLIGVLSFIVIPFVKQQLALLSVGGLALQGLGAWFLFNGLHVSPILIGVTLVLPLLYHRYVLLPILEKVRNQPSPDEDELLIGARGRVVKAIDPVGTINVRGEMWTATSDRPLEAGDEAIVLERDGLQVVVEGIKHKRAPQNGFHEN